ncbi:unnamed protein product [Nesidiocoris tenuis]|uniref:Uncharacterized protein n=1 Tax=Nesidiocoris tenuis TaxID=355587 RepID=A0A6H5GXI7_9HEMI|nr:unnamed protein product [Nesidiocoris tenuis]
MKSKSAVDRLYIFMQRCFFKLERAPGRERWFLQRADAIEWWIKNEKGEEKSAIRGSAAEKNAENHLRIKIWKYCVLSMHHWFQQGMCYRRYLRSNETLDNTSKGYHAPALSCTCNWSVILFTLLWIHISIVNLDLREDAQKGPSTGSKSEWQ